MVMTGDVHIQACRIIDVVNSLNQSVLFKCRNGPVNRVEGNGLEMFPDAIEYILDGRMVGVLEQRLEDLDSLVSDLETSFSADSFEFCYHRRFVQAVLFPAPCAHLSKE